MFGEHEASRHHLSHPVLQLIQRSAQSPASEEAPKSPLKRKGKETLEAAPSAGPVLYSSPPNASRTQTHPGAGRRHGPIRRPVERHGPCASSVGSSKDEGCARVER